MLFCSCVCCRIRLLSFEISSQVRPDQPFFRDPGSLHHLIPVRRKLYVEVFYKMNENVMKLLQENMWDLATCAGGEPNVVPVGFKHVTDDGKLVVGDVFLDQTLRNLQATGGRIAVSVYNPVSMEGYQIKGTADYLAEGPLVDKYRGLVEKAFGGKVTAKGVLIITPEKVIVTTPGDDNKKILN